MRRLENTQNLCKWFRVEILKLTLSEMVENSDTKLGTLSAFENKRSNNMNHIFLYLEKANEEQKKLFLEKLNENLMV